MNPYTRRILDLLGNRDPLETLAASPARLHALSGALGERGLGRSYGPGKWTARQILGHLGRVSK